MSESSNSGHTAAKEVNRGPAGEELAHLCVRLAAEMKAVDPVVLDLRGLSPFTDFFVIVSGRSDRQVKAIVDELTVGLKHSGVKLIGVEGASKHEWVIVDASDVVVHVFYGPIRSRYDLESLWADAPTLDLSEDLAATGPDHA